MTTPLLLIWPLENSRAQAELAGTQLPDGHIQNPTRVSSAMSLPEAYKLSLGACSSASLTGTKVPGLIN